MIPSFSAIAPRKDSVKATIPQQKPFINPATMLLNCGIVFCARTSSTGCASIVTNPIKENIIIEITGELL